MSEEFIRFLEQSIREWEEAAEYCEKHVQSVECIGEAQAASGKQQAELYRKRIEEHKALLRKLNEEAKRTLA